MDCFVIVIDQARGILQSRHSLIASHVINSYANDFYVCLIASIVCILSASLKADHALSKTVVDADPRYKDFEVTWSNDGY